MGLKMEGWARQGEQWREEVDATVTALSRQIRAQDKALQSTNDALLECVTRRYLAPFPASSNLSSNV